MRILMVTAELAPFAKTGGLGDAVAGLAAALHARGHDVRVLLPGYAHLHDTPDAEPLQVTGGARFLVTRTADDGIPVYLLNRPDLYADAPVYLGDDRDAARFLALCYAALELPIALAWHPQVYHCHDWHAAPLAPLLRTPRATAAGADSVPTLLSLHNIGYQGWFGMHVLASDADAPLRMLLEHDGDGGEGVNFLRSGVRHATRLVTVSPTYAREVQTPGPGMGLEDLLATRAGDFSGILNGVDYRYWSPATDPHLPHHYDTDDIAPKGQVRRALLARLGLQIGDDQPLIGVVSRITHQKGIDLLADALPGLLNHTDAAFALLGSGDSDVVARLRDAAAAAPSRVAFVDGYDEALAHLIIAGSDLFAIPSRYEPCGLTQMYALRYGTIPVVRRTGGLADTVQPFDSDQGSGNGGLFDAADAPALATAIRTAIAWWQAPQLRARLIANGMQADYSWARQVHAYESLYRALIAQD